MQALHYIRLCFELSRFSLRNKLNAQICTRPQRTICKNKKKIDYICGWKPDSGLFIKCIMARPIKETPILTGADADRFISEMERVDSLSKEERAANRKKLSEEFKAAMKHITLCL